MSLKNAQIRAIVVALFLGGILLTVSPVPASGQRPHKIALFGVVLKDSLRPNLRLAFKENGLKPLIRANENPWIDTYNAKGVLDGATEFRRGIYCGASSMHIAGCNPLFCIF